MSGLALLLVVQFRLVETVDSPWTDLIRSRTAHWQTETEQLAQNFAPVRPPEVVSIAIRTGGARDAFTIDAQTIAFDVSRLQALYGDATLPENRERIDRFFRHEYVHLLQKAWLKEHPYPADTPLRVALLGIWTEGLGNYYSLSPRWRGRESEAARRTLERLEPRFVARLAALACGSRDSARLLADLSEGRFEEKWGALPAALWLEAEGSPDAIRAFIVAGPAGVWSFAETHLPADSRAILREARAAAALCAQP